MQCCGCAYKLYHCVFPKEIKVDFKAAIFQAWFVLVILQKTCKLFVDSYKIKFLSSSSEAACLYTWLKSSVDNKEGLLFNT